MQSRRYFFLAATPAVAIVLALTSAGDVADAAPPTNDNLANASAVAPPATVALSTSEATVEGGEPSTNSPGCPVSPVGKTVWFKYTPAGNATLNADTFGSDFDTVLAVHTGPSSSPTFGSLTHVACNDDESGTNQSQISFNATAGTTYYFQVGGYADPQPGASGNLVFHIEGARYVVDTSDDDPAIAKQACTPAADDCSLRGAITRANTAGSPGDVITFQPSLFPLGGNVTITLGSGLPIITGGSDTIDGTGADVTIDGNGVDELQNFVCFYLTSAGNTIKGLKITDCAAAILMQTGGNNNTIGPGNVLFDNGDGVAIGDASGTVVVGNKIGTNATGASVHPDGGNINGLNLAGDNNTIGSANPADRNIISGNSRGIVIGIPSSGNIIRGNYIGTDAGGTVDLGNTFSGVLLGGPGNTIGGTTAGEGNLISGNAGANIELNHEDADGNIFAGNIVGPDVNGSGAAMTCCTTANIRVYAGADDNIIGPGNVISDGSFGIRIENAGTTGNVVKGNKIGTNPAGTAAVPNTASGVAIFGGSGDNIIGGTAAGDGNTIAFNGFNGVIISDNGVDNAVRGNSIHDNADIEINNLSGGNFELAPPAITAAGSNAVGGTACANCEVDVFSDGVADAEFYEGSVTADAGGQWALYAAIAGPNVTATNTDATGNTSELSAAVGLTAPDGDTDGVPNTLDNCPVDGNADQANADADGLGDVCDPDDDGDSLADGSDGCPTAAEDFDGFEDTDGCPDPDNDGDGVCDPGQTNISCTGSDFGRQLWQNPLGAQQDCRNVAEDVDGFHDDDGCPEPDNDYDGFPDATDDCPGTDFTAGTDGIADTGDEPLNPLPTLTREDDDGVIDTDGCHDSPGDDWDGDGLSDEDEVFVILTHPQVADTDADTVSDGADNCELWPNLSQALPNWSVPANDSDCDGHTNVRETYLGTDATKQCPADTSNNNEDPDSWPVDMNDNRIANTLDVGVFVFTLNESNPNHPGPNTNPSFVQRHDLNGNGIINTLDVGAYVFVLNKTCSPSGP